MNLHFRQRYQLHLLETRLRRSDPRLAGMLGMFGRLSAGRPMPSREQMPSRKDRVRQAAALLAEAVTVAAAAVRVLLRAFIAVVTAIVRGDRARLPAPQRGRTRPPARKRGRARSPGPKHDRANPRWNAGGRPDPSGWS